MSVYDSGGTWVKYFRLAFVSAVYGPTVGVKEVL